MKVVSAHAREGKVEFDVPETADGERITAVILDHELVTLSAEEKDLLMTSIASGEMDDGLDAFEALEANRDSD